MAPLTSIENLPTKMAANYARGRIPYIKINQIHSFSNSHFGWSIVGALLLGGGGEKEADQWRIIGRNQTHRYNNINVLCKCICTCTCISNTGF